MKTRHLLCFIVFTGFILVSSGQSVFSQVFQAVNDTIEITPGIPVTCNLLANDSLPAGDSVVVTGTTSTDIKETKISNGVYEFTDPYWGYGPIKIVSYGIHDFTTQKYSGAYLVFKIHDNSYDSLNVNNISARFDAFGTQFESPTDWPGFIVPKGSVHSTLFACSPWIGGLDADSLLHLAGYRYGQGPTSLDPRTHFDFYAGPVMDSAAYSIYQDSAWNYVWKLNKTEIEYHKTHWHDLGYVPDHDILTWPGNGNPPLGELKQLAPYYDNDGDGTYNPMHGDYPLIRGDQALYFIFNDDRKFHRESQGEKLGVEFHGMSYAFDLPEDSAFKNAIFLNYQIINRSQNTYHNTYLGIFSDLDIGFSSDDFIRSDVQRNSYIGYNGDAVDGDGTGRSYGAYPPAQAITFLSGPLMDPDGIDNPRKDSTGHQLCDESVTGFHFGDSIVDNEELGLNTFMSIERPIIPPQWDYFYAESYYNYMLASGLKYPYSDLACKFMYPGLSDTLYWGVGCQEPNILKDWTMAIYGQQYQDVSGVGSMGPFTFKPGDVEDVTVAFIFARDYGNPDSLASVTKVEQMIDIIRNAYNTNTLPNGQPFFGTNEIKPASAISLSVYPNPSNGKIRIGFGKYLSDNIRVTVTDMKGSVVFTEDKTVHSDILDLDLTGLRKGLYLIEVRTSSVFMKHKISVIY